MTISNVARDGNKLNKRIEWPADENFKGTQGILYVALADNRQESHVSRGKNVGRTLAHVAVTRVLKQVGTIDFSAASTKEIALLVSGSGNGHGDIELVHGLQRPRSSP
jgi:hypothetical protein